MKVKAKMKLLYDGKIYDAGTIFDMDDCTAAISAKYNKIEFLDEVETADELESVEGLPPLTKKKK